MQVNVRLCQNIQHIGWCNCVHKISGRRKSSIGKHMTKAQESEGVREMSDAALLVLQGLQAVLAAAYVEFPPTNGTAAAAQELAQELQALLAASGASANGAPAPKPAFPFKAPPGAPQAQPLPLSVGAADAAAVKEAVRRAAGPCSRGILRHLASVVAAVKIGGIKVGLDKCMPVAVVLVHLPCGLCITGLDNCMLAKCACMRSCSTLRVEGIPSRCSRACRPEMQR